MGQPNTKTYELAELTDFIRRVFALNLPQAVWVSAEIGQANTSRGNTWLTLVQKDASTDAVSAKLDAVVWKSQYATLQCKHGIKLLRDLLQDGMSVRLKVTTSFHPHYGLRLVVEEIDPSHTIGELERRRQLTLERLRAEDLLGQNSRLPLTTTPQKLAVISSDTAAGLADFKDQLARNAFGYAFDVRLFTAAMQGARTGTEIIARLKQIRQWPETFDAVIIIRGGGGKTDLAAFDDEDLARAVANYSLPVVVGIGHETDAAVLDVVAHTSLKTPTAVAVFLVDRLALAEAHVLQLGRDIHRYANQSIYHEEPRLQRLLSNIFHAAHTSLRNERRQVDQLQREIRRQASGLIGQERLRVESMDKLLQALRPETTLARGYALISQNGLLVSSAAQLTEGRVEVRFGNDRAKLTYDASAGDTSGVE